MPANHSITNRVITILIHSHKRFFKTFSFGCYVALLRMWRRRCFHGINAMILMPQIFDVTANENARYKRNELEYVFVVLLPFLSYFFFFISCPLPLLYDFSAIALFIRSFSFGQLIHNYLWKGLYAFWYAKLKGHKKTLGWNAHSAIFLSFIIRSFSN